MQQGAIHFEAFRKSSVERVCTQEESGWVQEAIETAVVGGYRVLTEEENAWALDLITGYRAYKREKGEPCP